MIHLSKAEAVRMQILKACNKYGAEAVVIDGHQFKSLLEARRYGLLKLRQRVGEIHSLEVHPEFPLHVDDEEIGIYEGDFRYVEKISGRLVVEDTKSPPTKTSLYRWKKKHFEIEYGIRIQEIEA